MVWILDSTVMDSGFFVNGSCIPDSGLENPGFRILRAEIFRVLSVLYLAYFS